jgi:hypothetical protein
VTDTTSDRLNPRNPVTVALSPRWKRAEGDGDGVEGAPRHANPRTRAQDRSVRSRQKGQCAAVCVEIAKELDIVCAHGKNRRPLSRAACSHPWTSEKVGLSQSLLGNTKCA